ncbi:hypothetical protein PHISP_02119 [Aspergillus sp. HF37]|nr:hypothetical protein PHISP_02119 [Aspergillus sp. HF37]
MSSTDPRIQPLPSDVVAKIKSSTSITHLSGVIVELAKNSLDANAQSVLVTVDFQRGSCVVEDDGEGIPPAEFEPSGGLGKAHHTSKYQPGRGGYERKGLFLASLASLSLLAITSHHIRHQSTNTIMLHHSSAVARLVPAPVQQRLNFSRHGTRATVNDLFGDMPVRVKSRALVFQKPDELEREWDHLRYLLVALMLANDKLKKLVLEDAGRNKKLTVRSRHSLASDPTQESELHVQRINSILAQSNLVDLQSPDCWNVVSASMRSTSIHAAISLVPSPTKRVQFISFGTEPLLLLNNTNPLYSEINRLFALSDFGTIGATASAIHTRLSAPQHERGNTALKSPTKTINKWPMFYIRINADVPQGFYDDGNELMQEDKSIQHIMDVLATMVNEFLKQHDLRPRAAKRERKTSQLPENPKAGGRKDDGKSGGAARLERPGAPASCTEESLDGRLKVPFFQKSASTNLSQITTWPRVKGAHFGTHNELGSIRRKTVDWAPSEADSGNSDGSRSVTPAIDLREQVAQHQTENDSPDSADAMIPWVDPYTGRTHLVNARTGQPMSPRMPALAYNRPRSTGSIQSLRSLVGSKRPATAIPSGAQGIWIENLLKTWDNPAFRRSERPITSMDVRTGHEHACGPDVRHHSGEIRSLEAAGCAKFRGKLRKENLELAEVIAQVDGKFIFARMKATSVPTGDRDSDTILTLIDQHAADERCRVEQLFEEMFVSNGLEHDVDTTTLSNAIVFEVGAAEVRLFRRYIEYFSSWGVHYSIDHKPESRVGLGRIDSLPTLIAERCRNEPNLATELIRAEIWKREENGGPRDPRRQDAEIPMDGNRPEEARHTSWVERLSGCPQGITDLLNSRACRSAIMFNDALAVDECQNLLSRLARCVLPFQCAHGRPSMVPILDLQSAGVVDSGGSFEADTAGRDTLGFVDAFKLWRHRDA